jgi:hypothetical protein
MIRRVAFIVSVQALLLGGNALRADFLLYNQNSNFPVSGANGVWLSQFDTAPPADGGLGFLGQVYDDFALAKNGVVYRVTWQGGYFEPASAGTPPTNNLTFTINFYNSNASGGLGSLLATRVVPNNAGESLVGLEAGSGGDGNLIFNYAADIAPVSLTGGNTYWLSIMADLNFGNNTTVGAWGWHTGVGGNGTALQDYIPPDGPEVFGSTVPSDMAFSLQTAPEPASISLFCSGAAMFLAWGGWRRWKPRVS